MKLKHVLSAIVICVPAGSTQFAAAAVSAGEAERLKSELTPMGAERAANKDGTIPAWDGGYTTVWPGYQPGQARPDPFAGETPLFRVTAANMHQYADKLSDGVKALLERFPSYRLDVYPTHRTAAAPQWVYDNTFRNATQARTAHNDLALEGAHGGIPFPIPKTGAEAIWNHLASWKGEAYSYDYSGYLVANGKAELASAGRLDYQYPYYEKEGTPERAKGILFLIKLITTAPPSAVGDNIVSHEPTDMFNDSRKTWLNLAGQRRVRRVPNMAYDAPNFTASGFSFMDEASLFNGAPDRYDWTLLGKREIFIPYNAHRFHGAKSAQVLGPQHLNPDHERWELHRVWVVEARLAAGKQHVMPVRRFYLDEDTWSVTLTDGWDAKGQLWHAAYSLPMIVPELPAVVMVTFNIYDLVNGRYSANVLLNDGKRHFQVVPRRPEDAFSPATLESEGIR